MSHDRVEVETPEERARQMREEPERWRGFIRSGADLDIKVFPPMQFTVPGIIPEGAGLLAGAPKAGKSWFGLGVALSVAAGGVALGGIEVGPARPVLYLALEDGERRLQERCHQLLAFEAIPDLFEYVVAPFAPALVPDVIDYWLGLHPDGLVILDTLGKVMPPAMQGETPYARDYRVMGKLKTMTDERPGSSLIVVHHDRKAQADDFVDSVSGTHGLAGAADFVIVLQRPRNEKRGLLKVTGRDVSEGEYAIETVNGAWRLLDGSLADAASAAQRIRATANLGNLSAAIVMFVDKVAPRRVSTIEVTEALASRDVDNQTVGTYLARLAKAGKVRRAARGLYASTVESVVSVETPGPQSPILNTSNTFDTDSQEDS